MTRNQIVMSVAKRWKFKKLMFEGHQDAAGASLDAAEPSFEEIGMIEDIASMFEAEGVQIKSDLQNVYR